MAKKPKRRKALKSGATTKLVEIAVELVVLQYQTVHVDTADSRWRQKAIERAEALACIRGGEIISRKGEITKE